MLILDSRLSQPGPNALVKQLQHGGPVLRGTVWSKLHSRKNERLWLLGASPLPGTCIFSSCALSDFILFFFKWKRANAPSPKPNPRLFTYFFLFTPSSELFSFTPLSASLALSTFLYHEESRGDWLEQLKLRGRWGPGLRVLGVCKAGLIPLKCCFTCP